jgi:LPS export ABC transporter permease LptG
VFDLSVSFFNAHATGWTLAQYLWYSTPQFVYYVIPIATLVAVLGTIGGLTRSSELTVMRACGVSLYRVAAPLVVLAVVSGGLLFLLEERVLAEANRKAEELGDTIHNRPHHTVNIANRNWLVGRNDRIYYYAGFDPQRAEIHSLSVFETASRPYRLTRQTYASVARCADRVCSDGQWLADSGWDQQFVKANQIVRTPFTNRRLALNPVTYFTLAQVDANMMTFTELRDYIRRSRASGFSIAEEEVNLQGKIAFPAVTLVMTALAIPFAVTTGRRGALYGIGLAIALSVAYWLLMAFFLAAGKAGLLPAPLAAWATNILFMAVAVYLVLTVRT